MAIISVDPFRCRLWSLHDRIEEHVNEESCRAEIASFQSCGQLVPTLGRPVPKDPDHDVEIIYGARRLFVARHLNRPLLVDSRELSDLEAITAMDIENRQRKDVSPYERGMSYRVWLRAGYFASQADIARKLNVSASQVSRLHKLAGLPAVVVAAFCSPLDIREEWGLKLVEILSDVTRRESCIAAARQMAARSPRAPSSEVFRRLLVPESNSRRIRPRRRDQVVHDSSGSPLFRIRSLQTSVALILPMQSVSANLLEEIRNAVSGILQGNDAARLRKHEVRAVAQTRVET